MIWNLYAVTYINPTKIKQLVFRTHRTLYLFIVRRNCTIKIKIIDIKRKEYRSNKKKSPDSMDLLASNLYAESPTAKNNN